MATDLHLVEAVLDVLFHSVQFDRNSQYLWSIVNHLDWYILPLFYMSISSSIQNIQCILNDDMLQVTEPVIVTDHFSYRAVLGVVLIKGQFAIDTSCVYFIEFLLKINMVIVIFPERHL